MTLAEQFHAWALDPARTNEELFTVELLLDAADQVWRATNKFAPALDWEAHQRHQKRRMANPAYRVVLDREALDRAVGLWAGVKKLENGPFEDRPVRDLAAVRFLPQLEEVALRSELSDLAGLSGLQGLRNLTLNDETVNDVRMLAVLPVLARVDLRLGEPWPSGVSALGDLPVLREFNFAGNLLVWRGAFALPAVERAVFEGGVNSNTPLRDLRGLPAMPRLTHLKVKSTASLRGLERFPQLVELELTGSFTDLAPLAGLTEVRVLKLTGERFFDLAPVARMASLRTLELYRDHGLDVGPLVEAPRLREVSAPRCTVLETELASLNAALGWVDESDYVVPEARHLGPPRLVSCAFRGEEYLALPPNPARKLNPRKAAYGDDPLLAKAEDRWFARELQTRLAKILTPGWGRLDVHGAATYLRLQRSTDFGRLRAVVQAFREVLARTRFPWECVLFYEPLKQASGPAADEENEADDVQTVEELSEIRQWRAERQRYLEIEHRMRLRAQQGLPPEMEADEPAEAPDPEDTAEAGDELEEGDFMLLIEEQILWVHDGDGENAADALGLEPEDWHLLPEPPEERPRRW